MAYDPDDYADSMRRYISMGLDGPEGHMAALAASLRRPSYRRRVPAPVSPAVPPVPFKPSFVPPPDWPVRRDVTAVRAALHEQYLQLGLAEHRRRKVAERDRKIARVREEIRQIRRAELRARMRAA